MKKILFPILIFVGLVILTSTECNKDDLEDWCGGHQMTPINRTFIISANVFYNDSVPWDNLVHFVIKKQYCDGSISGTYQLDHISADSQGHWFSGMQYSYKLANQADYVIIRFDISDSYVGKTNEAEYVLDYFDVDNAEGPNNNQIFKTFNITLPWASPGNKF